MWAVTFFFTDARAQIDFELSQGEIPVTAHELAPPGTYSNQIATFFERCPACLEMPSGSDQSIQVVNTVEVPTWSQWQRLCQWYFIAVDPIAHLLTNAAFEFTAKYLYESILRGQSPRD